MPAPLLAVYLIWTERFVPGGGTNSADDHNMNNPEDNITLLWVI